MGTLRHLTRRLIPGAFVLAAVVAPGSPVPAEAAAPSGTPWTFGDNAFGQLGDGTTTARRTPAAVAGALGDVVDLHGGREHVITLRADGTVWVWGSNVSGQLGLGTTQNVSVPTRVPSLSGIVAVETGHDHSVALAADGAVWTWGLNTDGQLGDGSTTNRRSPVRVVGLTDAVAIAAGRNMTYALRANGTVAAWGRNTDGQIGDGTTTRRLSPASVLALSDVVGIAGGRDHGLALRADGSVWAWGDNAYGQVGDGTTTDRLTPTAVTTGVTEVIAGAHHSYALRADGQVLSWGRNYRAELGDSTTTMRTRPVVVRNVTGAVSIGSGRDHGVAVLADGTVRAWGYNASGQLGDGTTTNRTTAISVPGITGAVKAGGGGQGYSVVLIGNTDPPPNQTPHAVATLTCDQLACVADGSASTDSDGTLVAFAWDFGDGTSATEPTVDHTFAASGTYVVTLTVTDEDGAVDTATTTVTVGESPPPEPVTFRAAAGTNANTASASVVIPSTVVAGDRLVLFVTTARAATMTPPAGWSQLGTVSDGTDVRSWLLTTTAGSGSAGSTVRVTLDALSKTSLTLMAYDSDAVSMFASAAELGSGATHVAPAGSVATAGSVVLRYWADKSSEVHGWTVPSGLTARATTTGSGGGMLTSLAADSGEWAPGPVPSQSATPGTASSKAVMWTVVLPPG